MWVFPSRLRIASKLLANLLKRCNHEVLFLNFSRNLEDVVKELADGVPYEYFSRRIKELGLVPAPFESWRYWTEPILLAVKGLRLIRPRLRIYCYKSPFFERFSSDFAMRVLRLVFKVASTGKVNVEEWCELVRSALKAGDYALREEADCIVRSLREGERGLCISNFEGRKLKESLVKVGLKVNLKYLLLPYHFTPLDILLRVYKYFSMLGETPPKSRILRLIEEQVKFVRGYVLTSRDYDEAYFRWFADRSKWLKSRVSQLYNLGGHNPNLADFF